MSSIEDVKKQFKTSLESDEPKKNTKSGKKIFLLTLLVVILGIVLNYYYFKNKNDTEQRYLPSDIHNVLNDDKEEDQDPLFQKF
tara:strand:- start:1520 stop:1771 length:252 start_codon:yes stop_codon:yes gene_type:complete